MEILEEVGAENIFIFGMKADEVADLKVKGYNPYGYYNRNSTLRRVLDMIRDGFLIRGPQSL